jgi:hypothetical protein
MSILNTEIRTKFEQYLSGTFPLIVVQSRIQRLETKHETVRKRNHKTFIRYHKAQTAFSPIIQPIIMLALSLFVVVVIVIIAKKLPSHSSTIFP